MKKILALLLKLISSKEALKLVFEQILKSCGDDKEKLLALKAYLQEGIKAVDDKLNSLS